MPNSIQKIDPVRKSLITLKTLLGDTTNNNKYTIELKKVMENYDTMHTHANSPESLEKCRSYTLSTINWILHQNKNVYLDYIFLALKEDPSRLDEVLGLITSNGLEHRMGLQHIKDLLTVATDMDKHLLQILQKINSKILFESRCSSTLHGENVQIYRSPLFNLIDKSLLEKYMVALKGNTNPDTIEKIIVQISQIPTGSAYLKTLIMKNTIALTHSIFAYNYSALKLLTETERLERFKKDQYPHCNNVTCYLLFSEDQGLLTLVGTDKEILTKQSIKTLFHHITEGKSLHDNGVLASIPTSVLEKLGVKKGEKEII